MGFILQPFIILGIIWLFATGYKVSGIWFFVGVIAYLVIAFIVYVKIAPKPLSGRGKKKNKKNRAS